MRRWIFITKRIITPRSKRKNRDAIGLTLIEILLVVSLLSVVSLAVFHSISQGIRVWGRARQYTHEEDAAIFFEKIGQDIRNSFNYSKLSFNGTSHGVSLPTIVKTPVDPKNTTGNPAFIEQIGLAEYFWIPEESCLYRRQANYSQALGEKFAKRVELIRPVQSLRFFYIYQEDGKLIEKNEIGDNGPPDAIRVELQLKQNNGKDKLLSRLFEFPRRIVR